MWLIFGAHFFAVYSKWYLDNKYTNLWLLCTIFSFCMFIIYGVKLEILRNKSNDKTT